MTYEQRRGAIPRQESGTGEQPHFAQHAITIGEYKGKTHRLSDRCVLFNEKSGVTLRTVSYYPSHLWDPNVHERLSPMGIYRSEPGGLSPCTSAGQGVCVRTSTLLSCAWWTQGAGLSYPDITLYELPTHPGGVVGYPASLLLSPHPFHCWISPLPALRIPSFCQF